jgi:hypothetical protein
MKQPSKNLSSGLERQLSMYALAASAAGVSLLALAQPADAKVIYTPTHKWLPVNHYSYLDLNHDGIRDFELYLRSSQGSGYFGTFFTRSLTVRWAATTQRQNEVVLFTSNNFVCAAALPKGTKVGAENFQGQLPAWMFLNNHGTQGSEFYAGPWLNIAKSAYLGLQFAIKGQVHYGWARLGHIRHDKPVRALLMGYAYETIPNKPIITGKTKGPDVITVQPGSLGRLAQGSPGLAAWRKTGDNK